MTAMLSITELSATKAEMYELVKELNLVSCIFEEEYKSSSNVLYCLVCIYKKVGDLLTTAHWKVLSTYLLNTNRLDEQSSYFIIGLIEEAQ